MIIYYSLAVLKGVNFMFRKKVLVTILSCTLMLLIVLLFQDEDTNRKMFTRMITISGDRLADYVDDDMVIEEKDINVDELENETDTGDNNYNEASMISINVVPAAVKREVVYDNMTMEELASKLDRSLKNELSGKGYLYASYSLEKGVDPYLAVAISLEETGCNYNCSSLVKTCNNVGGMKGSGCGSYGRFPTLDDGIRAFIDNISRNYVAYGLTTADTMNSKYAENPAWSTNVNNYIARIKNN